MIKLPEVYSFYAELILPGSIVYLHRCLLEGLLVREQANMGATQVITYSCIFQPDAEPSGRENALYLIASFLPITRPLS
ncbi:MAG: hypothetical protein H7A25_02040 [Leptospiraceae bacterium]|nr:hypothetical protein [Leptospiraceae bacterium]